MGPAVTSEAVSCEQGERLRNTASLSPHNVHSNPIPLTGMSTDEPVDTAECHSAVDPCSSSQPVELSAGVLTPTSNGQMTCSRMNLSKVVDNRLLSVSLKQHNDNFVNIKEIQGCKKMSIFLKNNSCSVLPNGGLNCTSLPDETKTVQVSACDETVPCGTVLPQLRLTKLSNSHQLQNNVMSGSKAPPTTIMSESQTTQSDDIRQPEVGSLSNSTVVNDGNFSQLASEHECVSQVASEEAESHQIPSSLDKMLARQKLLKLRASGLLRRLRRLQCREVNSAAKEGLGRLASSLGQTVCEKTSAGVAQKNTTKDALGNRELTTLSTAELVSYVQKMQLSQQQQQQHVCLHRQPSSHGGSLPSGNETEVMINDRVQSGMRRTAGQLCSNLRHLKSALDSDATESSSGGESGDEGHPTSLREASDVTACRTVCRKLEADWAKDRSRIISRWTWLQAQVSDLEYRIRQQSDIYKQLRLSKGSLSLRDPPCSAGGPLNDCDVNGRIKTNKLNTLADSENQKNSLASDTRLIQNEGALSRDGFCAKPLLPRTRQSSVAEFLPDSRLKNSDTDVPTSCLSSRSTTPSSSCSTSTAQATTLALDPTCRAARCLELHGLRRRTLLRSSGLHEVSRKASQLPTVRCTCYPPATPCALCGGRYDRVMRPGPLNSTRDRLAILDPSYHSVLSFPKDVPLSLRMAESLWVGPIRDNNAAKYSFRPVTVRVKSRTGSQPVSNEFQQEPEGVHEKSAKVQCHSGHRMLSSTYRDRRACLHSMETMQKKKKKRLSMNRKRLSKASLRPSAFKSSSRAQLLRRAYLMDSALKRQTSCSAFDINDVVIPSHVSSAARIDIIQYKEIVTPKWRKISKDANSTITSASMTAAFRYGKRPHPSASSENDCTKKVRWSGEELDPAKRFSAGEEETDAEEEFENLSDESFAARHLRYEIYEKKQCMPINVGHQRRSRSNRSESDSFTLLNPQSPDAGILDASASLTSSTLSVGPSMSCLGYSDTEDPGHHHFGDSLLARQQSEAKLVRSGFSALPSSTAVLFAPYGSEQLPSEQLENRTAPSWPPRTFPLGDFENEQLFAECPERGVDHRGVARSASPAASTSTESTEPVGEDPDDPEWTVTARNKDKPGLLIRFAKV